MTFYRYEEALKFHKFWSVDETVIQTGLTGLRSTFVSNENQTIKMVVNEPLDELGLKKSQIQEYLDYNNGPGVQHIALHTNNICHTVKLLTQRGNCYSTSLQPHFNCALIIQ